MIQIPPQFGGLLGKINIGIFSESPTSIDAIAGVVDLYTEENHNVVVTKTKYPVEDGSSRTDNFVVEPEKLVLKGFVSDLQSFLGGIVTMPNPGRVKEAWGRIKALKNSGDLVSVVTILGLYENMLVIGADATVTEKSGKSLAFTITLEETLIAQTDIVQLAPVKLNTPADTKGSTTEGGLKQSEETTTTILQDIVSGISGVFN